MSHHDEVEALFRDLHKATVAHLLERIKNPGDAGVPGEIIRQARELLRDNDITDAGRGQAPIHELRDALDLPFRNAE